MQRHYIGAIQLYDLEITCNINIGVVHVGISKFV